MGLSQTRRGLAVTLEAACKDGPSLSMNVNQLAPALRPFLPRAGDTTGGSLDALKRACDAFVQAPDRTPNPYPKGMPLRDRVETSRDFSELASRVQADFRQKLGDPTATMGIGQLRETADRAATANAGEAKVLEGEVSSLKRGYYQQVGKTGGWMAATLGALVMGGIFPSPVSAIAIVATASLCVRSIGKSRAAYKEMQQQVPQLQSQIKFCRQVAAQASFCSPLLNGWSELLTPGKQVAA